MVPSAQICYNQSVPHKKIQNSKTKIQWVDITKGDAKDRTYLKRHFDFDADDIEEAFRRKKRSTSAKRKHYIYIVVMVPRLNEKHNVIEIDEIDCFLSHNSIVTIHKRTIPALSTIQKEFQKKSGNEELLSGGVEFLWSEILEELFASTYPILDHVSDQLEKLKRRIFSEINTRETVKRILVIRRNITDMRRAMRGHGTVIANVMKFKRAKSLDFTRHQDVYEELHDDATEIWDTLESNKEMVEALEDANDAFISHTLNDVMKTLTAASVILLPAGVIAGVFGMNARNMPIVGHIQDFWFMMAIIGTFSLMVLVIFWKKNWIR